MNASITQDLVIVIDTPDRIFNDANINPFSKNVLEILGISGMEYITRQLQARRRDWKNTRLVIRMPSEQITPGFELRVTEALRRYCSTKAENNAIEAHLIRFRSSIGLGILLVIVAALIIIAFLLLTGPLAGVPQAVQVTIVATISLFAWVSLWDPLEALIFNPVALMRENYILHKLAQMKVVVEPQSFAETSAGATDIQGTSTSIAIHSEPKK